MASTSKRQTLLTGLLNSISSHLKPHRAEALQRIRLNGLCLTVLVVVASLLPFPSLPTAVSAVISKARPERWTQDWAYRWICVLEVTLLLVFLFNILESGYAIKFPPPALPPTPGKNLSAFKSPQKPSSTPKKPFTILSPHSSPQPQKAFSFSPSSSLASLTSSASGYPASPLSTPSRTVQYPSLSSSSSGTFVSSTSTVGYTPSPGQASIYRGKHFNGSVGHALDGSYLGRLARDESDEEEEE